jgi:glycosyltransferase involved in cell wall biosynthesis
MLHALPDTGGATSLVQRPVAFYQAVQRVIAQDAPAIVHDHGLWLPLHGAVALAAQQQGVPLVLSPKGMAMPWALRYKRWKKRLSWWAYQRWIMQQATLFHATSAEEVEALRALGLEQPIAMVPHGVDIPDALPSPRQCTDRTALFLSRLHPKKGLPMLLDAWAALQPEGWRLVLVGPDELGHRGELEEQVRRLGLERAVQFEGPVADADKWQWYADADLYILPTHSENFGIVVPEALAAGTPVITTTGAPWQDLTTHNCGWWVEPTTGTIQTALNEALACSDEERAAMGERGRRLVEEKYTWASVGEQMVSAYQWLLGRGERPACVQLSE